MNHLFAKPQNNAIVSTKNWQQQLSEAFTNIADLCQFLDLTPESLPIAEQAAKQFALKTPRSFASRMEKGNPNDPLLLQVLPIADELQVYPGFSADPVGDLPAAAQAGVIHKYHGRVLLINTGSCAINCRYCFRRNFPYGELQLSKQKEVAAIKYISEDSSISEVILSGGDPLLLNDARLGQLLGELDNIDHVKRIRIHSRLPIVLPDRITDDLVALLAQSRKQIIMVLHCNHAQELDADTARVCFAMRAQGITLFNQSVLLKGINDNAQMLCQLSETLFAQGVIPYYLHVLDKAIGTGHFEVSRQEAVTLLQAMQSRLPGYLVPKLVEELAGAPHKQLILG